MIYLLLISVKQQLCTYIGTTKCLFEILPQHNSGYGPQNITQEYLWQFEIMAYICGFNGKKKDLDNTWKCNGNLKGINWTIMYVLIQENGQ